MDEINSNPEEQEDSKEGEIVDHDRENGILTFHVHRLLSGNVFILTKRYRFVEHIAEGSFGAVCSAYDSKLEREVAIKKIMVKDDLVSCKRILRELIIMSYLDHPNIIRLLHVQRIVNFRKFTSVYHVTELMEGDLSAIIESDQEITNDHVQYCKFLESPIGQFPVKGTAYIHSAGIIHRDLKPQNILINSDCDIKICDFGLSTSECENQRLTQFVASRWYRAPELVIGGRKYDKSVDIWSLGCIFAEMLLRRVIFPGKSAFDQFMCFIKILGSPDPKSFPNGIPVFLRDQILRNERERNSSQPFQPIPFEVLFKDKATPEAIDLLKRLLCYDSKQRITSEDVLCHAYFSSLHDPRSEEVQPAPFTIRFEDLEKDYREVKLRLYKFSLFYNFEELSRKREEYFTWVKNFDGKDQRFVDESRTIEEEEEEEEEENMKKKKEVHFQLLDEIVDGNQDFLEENYQTFLVQTEFDEEDEQQEEELEQEEEEEGEEEVGLDQEILLQQQQQNQEEKEGENDEDDLEDINF